MNAPDYPLGRRNENPSRQPQDCRERFTRSFQCILGRTVSCSGSGVRHGFSADKDTLEESGRNLSNAAITATWKVACPTLAAKLVLVCLADHKNKDTGLCCPSLKLIAQETGMAESTAVRQIRVLKGLGYITVTRTGRSSHYVLHLPEQHIRTGVVSDQNSQPASSELAQCKSNQNLTRTEPKGNQPLSSAERVSLEKEADRLREERRAIRSRTSQDAFGVWFYSDLDSVRLEVIKARLAKIDEATAVPL